MARASQNPFDYVSGMNTAFGNKQGNPLDFMPMPPDGSSFDDAAWGRLKKQCENIGGKAGAHLNGELRELFDAIERHDVDGARDALCDICVFAMGAHHLLGYDFDRDMNSVLDGVMTRFSRTPQELCATVLKWAKQGITDVYTEGEFPRVCLKSGSDQTSATGEFIPKGKFLKSANYVEPVFYQYTAPAPPPMVWPAAVPAVLPPAPPARKFMAEPPVAAQRRADDTQPEVQP